jgi:hypothetical protein
VRRLKISERRLRCRCSSNQQTHVHGDMRSSCCALVAYELKSGSLHSGAEVPCTTLPTAGITNTMCLEAETR